MSILGSLFGYVRVIMFVPTDYVDEFRLKVIDIGLAKDVKFHKTTDAEAARFGIQRSGNYLSVTAVVPQKNRKRLTGLKNEFDRFVAKDRARKAEEAKRKTLLGGKKKKKSGPADEARQKIAERLKSSRSKGQKRIYRT